VRPQGKNSDGASDQHLAREDALALLHPGDVADGFDLVLTRPTLRRKQFIQSIGVGSRIGVGYDLAAFLVVGGVGDAPLDLVWRERDFKLGKQLFHVGSGGRRTCSFSLHGRRPPSALEVC